MSEPARYQVSGRLTNMRTTYLCDTTDEALSAYDHLVKGNYEQITITAPDGGLTTAAKLGKRRGGGRARKAEEHSAS